MTHTYFNIYPIKVTGIAILLMACGSFLFAQEIIIEKELIVAPKEGEQIGFFSIEDSDHEPKAFLGVMLRENSDYDGLEIVEYTEESAVEKAGIPVGARLLTLDMEPIVTIDGLLELLSDKQPGDKVSLRYVYEEEAKTVDVILGERPKMKGEKKVIIKKEKGGKDHWGNHNKTYAPDEKRIIIRRLPHAESMGGGFKNDLNIENITIERGFQSGDLHLKFSGIAGKVDVVLRKERGQVVERIVYEDLQEAFEHHFKLGSGAQGVYYLQIKQDGNTYTERIYF